MLNEAGQTNFVNAGASSGLPEMLMERLTGSGRRSMAGNQNGLLDVTAAGGIPKSGAKPQDAERAADAAAGQTIINIGKAVPHPVVKGAAHVAELVGADELVGKVVRQQPGIKLLENVMGKDPAAKAKAWQGANEASKVVSMAGGGAPSLKGGGLSMPTMRPGGK